ncbi:MULTISPECIES: hypothetical protein [Paraburkholderia]|nr:MULTISPECIES: hypothetical protein [Paraburkholderia]MDH6146898.1 hypothetical protein [Paraburkholderia sp. WSM4179]
MTKLILANAKTGEFSAIMQDEDVDADQINKLSIQSPPVPQQQGASAEIQ